MIIHIGATCLPSVCAVIHDQMHLTLYKVIAGILKQWEFDFWLKWSLFKQKIELWQALIIMYCLLHICIICMEKKTLTYKIRAGTEKPHINQKHLTFPMHIASERSYKCRSDNTSPARSGFLLTKWERMLIISHPSGRNFTRFLILCGFNCCGNSKFLLKQILNVGCVSSVDW